MFQFHIELWFLRKFIHAIIQQADLVTQSEDGITKHSFLEQGALLQNDAKHLAVINGHFKTQRLKCSMDNLQKEVHIFFYEASEKSLADHVTHHKCSKA